MGRQRLNPALQYGRRHDHQQEVAELPPPVGDDPAFVMLVKTNNAGTSGTNQMTLPLTGSYTIDWGDGVVENLSGAQTHTYPAVGEYTIRITGGLTRIAFAGTGDRRKVLDIRNWGDIAWTTMAQAFYGCQNLTSTATDVPDLSSVATTQEMFFNANTLNVDSIAAWDMSNITVTLGMFNGCSSFNGNISGWDVSKVTNMANMFSNASVFNQNIGGWNTANATTFHSMFVGASAFNQDIGGWNTAKATSMTWMFRNAFAFDQNLGGWNMSSTSFMTDMLFGITLSPANYGATLIGWAAQTLQSGVNFNGGLSKYPTDGTGNPATDAAAARAKIIADFGWTISDGGPV